MTYARKLAAAACALAFALAAHNPALAQSAPDGKTVVAIVNGKEIQLSELMKFQASLPEQYRQLPLPQIYPQLVEQMINRKLVSQAAAEQNLADDPLVKERVAWITEQIVQEIYLQRELAKRMTDDKIRAEYDKRMAALPAAQEVHARHILVETEDEAKVIIAEVQGGTDFAELATKKSTGPSSSRGGDLGWFSEGDMVPEFSQAAFAMEAGAVSETPVKTQFGWHVIKVEERRDKPKPSFAEEKQKISTEMTRTIVGDMIREIRAAAKVETFNMDGTPTKATN